MTSWMRVALAAVWGTGLLAGCGHDDKTGQAEKAQTVQAAVATVEATTVAEVHAAPANLVALESAQVASRLMGYIQSIDVVEGQAVKAGQRLFTIDPADARSQSDQSAAALADAKANYERYANLYKDEAVSRQQYEKMKLAYDQARAAAEGAGNQLRYAVVASPINGVVTRKLANAGSLAVPGQPVLVVENPARLQVETQVGESILRGLKLGDSVDVEVDGLAQAIEAKVARLSPAADPVSRTFLVKLDIAGEGLRSGLFARALFKTGERQAVRVPKAALVERAGITGVFVVDAQGVAHFRMVRGGAEQGGLVEIQAGLAAGERIVVDGATRLESGDKVQG